MPTYCHIDSMDVIYCHSSNRLGTTAHNMSKSSQVYGMLKCIFLQFNPLLRGVSYMTHTIIVRARILGKMDNFYFLRHVYETCLA
jgi:hypothetical protein